MLDLTSIKPIKKGDTKMITGPVMLSFPFLTKKNTTGEFPSGKYEANFAFSKLDKLTADMIRDCMTSAIKAGDENGTAYWGAKGRPTESRWFSCVKEDKYARTADDQPDPNGLVLRTSTQYQPALLDVTGRLLSTEEADEALYSGAIVRAQVEFFPWLRGGKGGVSAQLTVVQKLADGTHIGGSSYDASDFALSGVETAAPAGEEKAEDLPF